MNTIFKRNLVKLGMSMGAFSILILALGGCPVPPSVTLTNPDNGATDVPINMKITATFSAKMNPGQFTTSTFLLEQGTTPVTGTVAYNGTTAIFAPTSDLTASTLYTATITASVTDVGGAALSQDYVWTFTTGTASDTTPPAVQSTTPAENAASVVPNTSITVDFSKTMDPTTITAATFLLSQGTSPVAGTVTSSGATATFTPTSGLTPFAIYSATITTGVADLAGNTLAQEFTWDFTTGANVVALAVTQEIPANGAVSVAVNTPVVATFSTALAPLTITTTTFTLAQGTTAVSGTVVYTGTTAIFTPTADLTPNTTYTATITTGVTDAAGNPLPQNQAWTFTTAPAST